MPLLPLLPLFLLLPALLCLLATPASASLPPFFPPSLLRPACPVVLPTDAPTPRVLGGIPAIPRTISYLVALSHPNNSFACTGSLLSSHWVLTAAHCNVRSNWIVRIATVSASNGPFIPIDRIFVHESYVPGDFDAPGDIALIYLARPAPPSASFVRINTNFSVPLNGAFARTSGYGRKHKDDRHSNPAPYQVDAPVNNPEKCRRIYHGHLVVEPRYFICVGYHKSGCNTDSCSGDSGGPLVTLDPTGAHVQIGIVSFGVTCGTKGVPSVYVRVSAFYPWLVSKGAVFTTSSNAVSTYADGSEQAATNETTITVLQGDPDAASSGSDMVTISKVWFIIICVIAGIAVIALIFVSLAYVSGHRRSDRDASTNRSIYHGESIRSLQPTHPSTTNIDHDNLQLAISLLRSMANEESSNSSNNPNPNPEQSRSSDSSKPHKPDQTGILNDLRFEGSPDPSRREP